MLNFSSLTKKDQQYMALCYSIANIFSTCGKKKYAAVLLDDLDHVVGMGYNGGPRGTKHCEDGGCPRLIEDSKSGSNYDNCIAIHAEANALLHSDYSTKPKKIYVNGPPCFSCAKLIINSTIQSVYCIADSSYEDWPNVRSFLLRNSVYVMEMDNASV